MGASPFVTQSVARREAVVQYASVLLLRAASPRQLLVASARHQLRSPHSWGSTASLLSISPNVSRMSSLQCTHAETSLGLRRGRLRLGVRVDSAPCLRLVSSSWQESVLDRCGLCESAALTLLVPPRLAPAPQPRLGRPAPG